MKNRRKLFLLTCLPLLCLGSFAQADPSAEWTAVCFNKTRAYFYQGELKDWKQVTVLNLLDTFQIRRVASERKKQVAGRPVTLNIKGSTEGNYDGMVNLLDVVEIINSKYEIKPLNEKEKELFELTDLDTKPKSMDLKGPEMPGNKFVLYIRIKNDSSIWYKADTVYNEKGYSKVNMQDKTGFSEFIGDYLKKCQEKKIKETIFIAGSEKSKFGEFSIVINELKKHKIYNYNLITAPD